MTVNEEDKNSVYLTTVSQYQVNDTERDNQRTRGLKMGKGGTTDQMHRSSGSQMGRERTNQRNKEKRSKRVILSLLIVGKLIKVLRAHLDGKVVLPKVRLEDNGQREVIDCLVGDTIANGRPGKMLQTENESPVKWLRQHGLKEHTVRGVLVVLNEAGYSW